MKKLILFIVLLLAHTSMLFSGYTYKDRGFGGPPMITTFANGWFSCISECEANSNCVAYEYEYSAEQNGICLLFNCGINSPGNSLYFRDGFVAQQLKDIPASQSCCCSARTSAMKDVNPFNGSCFAISADKATWENAKMTCESHMMQLASIHSLNENRLISSMMENEIGTAWIGLRNYTDAKGLAWIDGTPVDFLNWATSEPNWNGNCVRVRARDNDWLDRQCSSTFVCVCVCA